MRILHVVEATIAGVRTHVQVVTAGLDQRRFQSVVACPLRRENACGDDQFVDYLTSVGIPIVPVAMRRSISPRADVAALWRLVGVLQSRRCIARRLVFWAAWPHGLREETRQSFIARMVYRFWVINRWPSGSFTWPWSGSPGACVIESSLFPPASVKSLRNLA